MDGDIRRPPGSQQPTAPSAAKKRRLVRKKVLSFIAIVILVIGAVLGGWVYSHRDTSPIPKSIQKAVNFPIYYPDPKKLPAGYSLDINSFSTSGQAVVYQVNNGSTKLVFSLQQKPSDQALQQFYTQHIPLHTTVQTVVGTATIGAIGTQTVVSLPTAKGSWILITAPGNYDQNKLKSILMSIRD